MTDTIHQVSFVDVKESYSPGISIQCRYTIKETFVRSNKDWIGVYKVGWRSYDNYETYVWVQMPTSSGDAKEVDCEESVTFSAESLPKDSRDFYQFCYVSSANQVCGVSTPFQFCTSMDDLVEVQDPDDPSTMVIKTRSQVLEEQVAALKAERRELQKETQLLHLELDAERTSKGQLMTQLQKMTDLQDELDAEQRNNERLIGQIEELQRTLQTERKSNEQLHEQIRGMRDELLAERMAHEDSSTEQFKEALDHEPQSSTGIKELTELDVSDKFEASLGISDASNRDNEAETAGAVASAADDAESKQMSFTERITGSVLKHLKRASDWFSEDFEDDQTMETEAGEHAPPAAADRAGQSLSLCPVCNEAFRDGISEHEIALHIDGHNGPVCPFCFMQFDKGAPENEVTAHVTIHLDNPNGVLSF